MSNLQRPIKLSTMRDNQDKERKAMLRHNATMAEVVLWKRLRNRGVCGLKFRRQYQIGSFFVDFYCPSLSFAIEIDGSIHGQKGQSQYDATRTEKLNSMGITVLRFTNALVLQDVEAVAKCIERFVDSNRFISGGILDGVVYDENLQL